MGNYVSQDHSNDKNTANANNFSNFLTIFILFLVVLAIGILGFYIYDKQNWIESFYNATTTMSNVGATVIPSNNNAIIFSGLYSLFTGLFFVYIIAFFIGTWINHQVN